MEENQTLDRDKGNASLVPNLPLMINGMVYSQRIGLANVIAKIAEREPCRNVAIVFMLLKIASGDDTFDTPEKARAES
ncbi:uncharacterized protein N7503_002324 [Penicillium pulvis]|uniref:uncharacterized protein n=1 Tax=Penicillium pulvis TaxID=1562058 RepID=UPI002546AAA5|nr:uncharacterized protein N7503_002324 [Penicillium pulvis]KAJ5810106.1 hypothetical protein N7503_002324 [Penicillium pulvis]